MCQERLWFIYIMIFLRGLYQCFILLLSTTKNCVRWCVPKLKLRTHNSRGFTLRKHFVATLKYSFSWAAQRTLKKEVHLKNIYAAYACVVMLHHFRCGMHLLMLIQLVCTPSLFHVTTHKSIRMEKYSRGEEEEKENLCDMIMFPEHVTHFLLSSLKNVFEPIP